MKKFTVLGLAIMLVLAMSVMAFAADYAVSTKPQGKHGGTLISTLLSDPDTWNAVISTSTASGDIVDGFIFEPLTTPHGITTEMQPVLAKSWEVTNNDLTVIFHLRDDVKWSDGVQFTADDVVFTLDLIYDENIPTSSRDVLTFQGQHIKYKAVDKFTVQIDLPCPAPSLLNNLPYIMPKHKLYDAWKAGKFNETWGIDTPVKEIVGTGPFILSQYKPGERVVMEKNKLYWRKDPAGKSLPYITRWVREIVGNQESMALKFENGESFWLAVQPADFARMKDNAAKGNYTVYNGGPVFSSLFVTFNMNPRNPNFEKEPWKLEWFSNLHFRKAVAYAIDKQTMIDQVYAGLGTSHWAFMYMPNKFYYNSNVPKYEYNLDKAKEELKAGGFSWNAKGELVDKTGRVVEFVMSTNAGNRVREAGLNLISNELNKLGMKVHATPIDFNKLVDQLMSEFTWETMVMGLSGGGVEPNGSANTWRSDGNLHMWNPRQEKPATEWEARIDELFDLGGSTMDVKKRQEYYFEAQKIAAEQLPMIFTVTQDSLVAVRNTLKNVEYSAFGGVTWNIEELWIDTK